MISFAAEVALLRIYLQKWFYYLYVCFIGTPSTLIIRLWIIFTQISIPDDKTFKLLNPQAVKSLPTSKRLIVIISWCLHLIDLCKNRKFMQPVISFNFILTFLGPCPLQSHKCLHGNAQLPTYFDEEVIKKQYFICISGIRSPYIYINLNIAN